MKQFADREAQSVVNDARLQTKEEKHAVALEAAKRAAAEAHTLPAATQSNAKEAVRSNVWSLLSCHLPSDDEYDPIFKNAPKSANAVVSTSP